MRRAWPNNKTPHPELVERWGYSANLSERFPLDGILAWGQGAGADFTRVIKLYRDVLSIDDRNPDSAVADPWLADQIARPV